MNKNTARRGGEKNNLAQIFFPKKKIFVRTKNPTSPPTTEFQIDIV